MNLANLAQRNYAEPGLIAYNAAMYIAVESHKNKEMLVCRPHPQFVGNEDYIQIFRRQGQVTASFTSERILRYVEYEEDDRGPFWYMSPGKYISLARLMVEKPGIRLDERWSDGAIDCLMETVQYVNKLQHFTLELTPHSVLVTKGGGHTVTLMPPLTDFIPIKDVIWQGNDEAVAPELYTVEEPTVQTDIYGIARVIEYLYSYTSIPYKYASFVKAATNERVDARPHDVNSMRNSVETRKKTSHALGIIASLAVVIAIFAVALFYPWTDEPQHHIEGEVNPDSSLFDDGALTKTNGDDPLVNTDILSASQAEKNRLLDEYMHDSSYLSMDTAETLSPEAKAHQRKMMQMAADKFRSAFKLQARSILAKVYTKQNMKSHDLFMRSYDEANKQIVEIEQALINQYQIDPTTGTRISAEVLDEIAEQFKKQLNKE